MGRTESIELTTICLIHQGDRYLLQNRVKEDWKGYTLPGGHVEPGESILDAVVREMKEETGLTIHNPKLCGVKQFPIKKRPLSCFSVPHRRVFRRSGILQRGWHALGQQG